MASKEENEKFPNAGAQGQQRQDEVSRSQSASSFLNWTEQASDDFPAVEKKSKQTRQCKETASFEPRNLDDWQEPALGLGKTQKELKETDKVKSIQMASEVEVEDKELVRSNLTTNFIFHRQRME